MPTEGICLELTHVGTLQVFLSDVHDGVDANGRVASRKPGPLYISPGQTVALVYTSSVSASFESGVIRTWIDQGILTHVFTTGPTYPAGTSLPALAGVQGAVLVEDPIGTLVFRRLTDTDIDPDFAISSFSASTGTVEVGSSVVTPSFTASYVRTPDTATLDDSDGTPQKDVIGTPTAFSSNGTFSETVLNASVTFTLAATETATGGSDSDNASITWSPRTFWGVDVDGLSTEADIEGLANSALDNNRNRTFTVSPGAGEHIYYAYPASYGAATFTVGGFTGGFVLVSATLSVTNPFGVTGDYRLYKSVNANLGATTVVVS
ncbi:hypothetical protein N9917_00095 [Deltaproteobacteria bacterium]|nr:hypothetical protein [Deltaproteobacteria bacterium]